MAVDVANLIEIDTAEKQLVEIEINAGTRGVQGIPGVPGAQGPVGPKGDKGDKGDTGERGLQGEAGPKGDTGDMGPQGPQGVQGIQGPKGDTPVKGVDYFTPEDIASLNIPTATSDLTNDSGYITNSANDLVNYTLGVDTGSTIDVNINTTTYVMTIALKNASGTTISTDTVDLPLESMVVDATYDNVNKKIVLTLQNGTTIDVPVGDLVSGLQPEITSNNKLSADLVDDTNTTNKFFSGDYDDLENKPVVAKTIKTYANMQEIPFDFSTAEIGSYINTYENWFCYKTGSFSVRRIGSADFSISEFVINKTVAEATDNEIIGYAFGFQNNIGTGTQKTVNGARCQFNIIKQSSGEVIIDTSVYTVNNANYITGGYQKFFGEKEFEYAPKLASYSAPTSDIQLTAKKYVDDKVAKYTTMPTSILTTDLGKVVQYVGETDINYTKGRFYEVVQPGGSGTAMSWAEITVDDLSGKQDTIDSSHKLSADLVDDSTATNKFVTTSDKTTWSGKQDALVSGTNIKTINNESILGSGNITIQGGGGGDTVFYEYTSSGGYGIYVTDATDSLGNVWSITGNPGQPVNFYISVNDDSIVGGKIVVTDLTHNTSEEITITLSYPGYAQLQSRETVLQGVNYKIQGIISDEYATKTYVDTQVATKQNTLVSGTTIKTINNESILGSGNITIQGGGELTAHLLTEEYSTVQTALALDTLTPGIYQFAKGSSVYIKAYTTDTADYEIITSNVERIKANLVIYEIPTTETTNNKVIGHLYLGTTSSSGVLKNIVNGIQYRTSGFSGHISLSQYSDSLGTALTSSAQTISGVKTFSSIPQVSSYTAPSSNTQLAAKKYVDDKVATKQNTLVSGTNIKTINNESLLGSGNIDIQGGGGGSTDVQINGTSIVSSDVANIVTEGTYNASTNKIATMSDVQSLITYSTTDISPGDPLASGTLYIVYE